MKLIRGLRNPSFNKTGCVATIGNFDGVHLGHQKIVEQLREKAAEKGLPSLVMVFEPQPLEFFRGQGAPARIMSFREKFEALRQCQLDALCCMHFDAVFSKLSATEFVERILVAHLNVKHLVIGDDFRFGDDRTGDFEFLEQSGERLGFSVESTPTYLGPESLGAERVSSTRIRRALERGEFEKAEVLLGKAYRISGRVLHGQKLGRTLGFPTANLALVRQSTPLKGVYLVKVFNELGRLAYGVANVGTKPTVGQFKPNLEVHLLDFEQNLYGKRISVEFVSKIREEQRFDGLDALKQQINEDVSVARKQLNEIRPHT